MSSTPALNPARIRATYAEAIDPQTAPWRARGLAIWLLTHAWEILSVDQVRALRALLAYLRPGNGDGAPPAGAPRTRPRAAAR